MNTLFARVLNGIRKKKFPQTNSDAGLGAEKMKEFKIIKNVVIACLLFILLKIVDVFHPFAADLPLYFLLYPIYFGFLIWSLIKKKIGGVISSFIVLNILFFGISSTGAYFAITPVFEKAKLHVLFLKYDECKMKATPLKIGGALAMCDNYDRGAYFDGIVYDSSDEINLGPQFRSKDWWDVAAHRADECCLNYFDFKATGLGKHFFYVKYDSSHEIIPPK